MQAIQEPIGFYLELNPENEDETVGGYSQSTVNEVQDPGQQPLLRPKTFTLIYYWNLSLRLEGWVCDRSERLKQGRKCLLIINGGEWDWGLHGMELESTVWSCPHVQKSYAIGLQQSCCVSFLKQIRKNR